jgi:uncharacterized delta-60 repeat protein
MKVMASSQLYAINCTKAIRKSKGYLAFGKAVTLTAFLIMVMAKGMAFAQSGTPDPAFGVLGRSITTFDTNYDEAFAVALQSDGKIVVAGATDNPNGDLNFAVIRHNPDGSLDPSFGSSGAVITNFRTDVPDGDPDDPNTTRKNSEDTARAVGIQPDGKIIVAGISNAPAGDSNFALIRYNPDGSVDPTFGDNSIFPGTTLLDFRDNWVDEGRAMVFQPDGKIIVAGYSTAPTGVDGNFALVRYDANGILDPTFGDNTFFPGTILTDFGGGTFDGANAVAVLPNGQLVAAGLVGFGGAGTECDQAFGLVRYNNGVPDTGFGVDNRVVTCLRGDRAQANAVVVQSTGQIVAVGRTNGPNGDFNFTLARYNSDGSLDATFNPDSINPGISITDFDNRADGEGGSERSFDEALAAAIQADGRIVAAGTSNAPIEVDNTNFAVTRYTPDGIAITDFGTNNRVLTDVTNTSGNHVTNSSTDRANAIAIQPDGLIVVVGGTDSPVISGSSDFNIAVVRYLP